METSIERVASASLDGLVEATFVTLVTDQRNRRRECITAKPFITRIPTPWTAHRVIAANLGPLLVDHAT